MSWRAVVSALDGGEAFRSRISMYLHPLAGRPVLWHVVAALLDALPPPDAVCVLHRPDTPVALPDLADVVTYRAVEADDERGALVAALAGDGTVLLVDGAAPLLSAGTLQRVLDGGRDGAAAVGIPERTRPLAVAADAARLAAAEDPWLVGGPVRPALAPPEELVLIADRQALARAGQVIRDRLVRRHEAHGVTFLLPESVWLDVDVRIGADTVVYPGVVLEGATVIGSECVIGPHSRLVEASIGRGVELGGWNYVSRTSVRNHAVLEPYAHRGLT